MRKLIVVSRCCSLETKTKLFCKPLLVPGKLGVTVRKLRTFFATESNLDVGIMFPGKAVRHCTPPTVFVVEGSKICPVRTCDPSQGLITGCPLLVTGGPRRAEKLPF